MERTCENCNTYNICKHKAKEEGKGCWFHSPAPTNADRIRNMSDEELALFLYGFQFKNKTKIQVKEMLKQPRKVEE